MVFKAYRSFLVSCVLSTALTPSLFAGEKLTILYLNDTHGQIEPVKDKDGKTFGGFTRIAYLVDSLRREAKTDRGKLYFFHAGDALMGPPISNISAGALDFDCFNDMSLTAMAVGNHEFDFGPKRIMELKNIARFPLLAANITDTLGKRPFQWFLKDSAGPERLLIVGLVTESTPVTTYPPNVSNSRFLNPESTLTALLDSLGYGDKDIVIVLSHRGWEADSAMALNIHDVDLIIGGHSHTVIEKPHTVAKTVICQTGAKGIYLGKIDLEIADGNIATWRGELIPVTGAIPEDSTLAAKINTASKELDQQLRVPIGKTEIALVPGLQSGRTDVLSLGDLLARLMREETRTDIAFTNQGGVRATIPPGPITMMEIYAALPFENTVVTMELTGAQIQEVLDRNFSAEAGGAKHHFNGIEWGNNIPGTANALIHGKSIDPKKTYRIATNNFLARGGDGYFVLTSGQHITDTGTTLNALLILYIERVGTITGKE